ncbi:MAG: AMP-binding protein [Candidatus Baltobacteraceae bacterium]
MYAILDGLTAERRAGLVFVDSSGHRRDYTFAEAADQSQRYAAVLRAIGVQKGQFVAVCNANTAKCIFLLLALERLGAQPVLCGDDLTGEELLARMQAFAVSTVVTNRRGRRHVEWVQAFLPAGTRYVLVGEEHEKWARMDTLARSAKPYAASSREPAAVGARVRHIAHDLLQARTTDRVWSTFPFGTDRWLTFAGAPLVCGAATIVHEGPFKAHERLDLLHELETTILCQTAHEYAALLDAGVGADGVRLPRLRRCIASDGFPELTARWQQATGKVLHLAAVGTLQL